MHILMVLYSARVQNIDLLYCDTMLDGNKLSGTFQFVVSYCNAQYSAFIRVPGCGNGAMETCFGAPQQAEVGICA